MTGIEAGKTWSRIGAEVAPTSSAASGVWGSLNEVSGYVGAGTWPAPQEDYQLLSTTTVSVATDTISLMSIPQAYRDLNMVVRSASRATYGEYSWVQLNGDSTNTNYRLYYYGAIASGAATGTYSTNHMRYNTSRMPYGDWPHGSSGRGSLNERQAAEFHIPNYTAPSATSGTGVYCFSSAMNNIASPNNNYFFQWTGMTWNGTTAVTSIDLYATQTGSAYLFQPNTQVSLYGIGTAP
jgi:hypothetical protein